MRSPSRYILYTRVSTQEQDSNNSHESQLAALQAHVVKRGGLAVDIIRETASGGSLLGRPGIGRAIELLENDEADVLLCYDFSRYSRNVEHQQQIVRRLSRAGKRLEFATIDFQTGDDGQLTPESDLMFGVSGSFAAYHKKKIRADCMRGAKQAAEKGNQTRRKSPFGYHIVNNTDVLLGRYEASQIGQYFIVEREAALVREMYSRRASGQSLTQIAYWLAEQGVKTRSGAVMTGSALSKMLSNSVYKGQAHFGQTRRVVDESRLERGFKRDARQVSRAKSEIIIIPAPPIVDESLWNHVYSMRTTADSGIMNSSVRFRKGEMEAPTRYLLSSILRCPRCGKGMSGRSMPRSVSGLLGRTGRPKAGTTVTPAARKRERFYVCRVANSAGPKEPCLARHYRIEEADDRVIEFLKKIYSDETLLSSFLQGQQNESEKPSRSREIQKEISGLEAKERTLIEAQMRAMDSGADSGTYERMIIELSQERARAQNELKALEKSVVPKTVRDGAAFRRMLENVRSYLEKPLTPGSISLHELHCFLVAQIESIEFEEIDMGPGTVPRYQIGQLKIKAR